MNLEFFILGGYGQFVWPAFIFSFAICAFFLVKAKKELKKHEKMYLSQYGKLDTIEISTSQKQKSVRKVFFCKSI
tara:strand:- start:404 stop:628 length:225 start_codon:yes stop_codon:yes gene_type:complete